MLDASVDPGDCVRKCNRVGISSKQIIIFEVLLAANRCPLLAHRCRASRAAIGAAALVRAVAANAATGSWKSTVTARTMRSRSGLSICVDRRGCRPRLSDRLWSEVRRAGPANGRRHRRQLSWGSTRRRAVRGVDSLRGHHQPADGPQPGPDTAAIIAGNCRRCDRGEGIWEHERRGIHLSQSPIGACLSRRASDTPAFAGPARAPFALRCAQWLGSCRCLAPAFEPHR